MKKILLALVLSFACSAVLAPRESLATVAENNARDVYTGNGSSTVFPYTFKILAQTELAVYVNGVLKALTTDYTVSGVGNDGGGSVTFLVAPTNGHQVLILRNVDISQISVYTPNEAFPATRVERDLDRQAMVNQMQQEEINRAIKLNPSVSGVTTSFTPVAGKCFGLNVGGTAITNFDCEGGGGGGTGDITDVLATAGEITVTNPGGPSPQVGLATDLNLSTKVLQGGSPLVLEGSTSDAFETTVVVTDPTADRTFTIPNADSVAVQPSTAGANQFANGVSAAGVVAYAQPSFSNLSGTATRGQLPSQIAYDDENNTWSGNNTFLDEDGLKIVDGADNTRVARFQAGSIASGATRTLTVPNLSGTLALADTAQTISGANTFSVDQTWGTGARAIVSNLGIRGTASDTNPACGAGDYTIYADLSEGKWKRCDNGALSDLGSSGASDGQHQIDGVNVSANDPINFRDTATIDFTNPSAGNIDVAVKDGSITDTKIAAGGITTRTKLPAEVVYDDEANTFTNTQSFTTPLDIRGGTAIVFEGATANDFETSLVITDPTADRTVTIPDASGEVSLLGQTISGSEMVNNTVGPTQIDETANYSFTGKMFPSVALASLPAPGNVDTFSWVNDCESSTNCSAGLGSVRILHFDDGSDWIPIFPSAAVPSLQQVGNVGRILEADCSDPLKVAKPGDATTYWKICHDATDGLQIIPVVGGVEHAANKRVMLKDGYDWGISDNDGVDIFNVAETGAVTNAKIDVEGTGNTITTISEVNLPVVLCDQTTGTLGWHTVDANKPTATCSAGGTNTTMIRGVADFPDSDGDYSIQHAIWLPDDLTGTMSAHFMWRTSATSGDVVWQLQTACTADNEVDDVAWNAAQTVTDTANGTANRLNTATISSVTLTGCTAGEQFRFRVLRNRTHGSDTLAAVPSLANFKLKMRRAQ